MIGGMEYFCCEFGGGCGGAFDATFCKCAACSESEEMTIYYLTCTSCFMKLLVRFT